MSLNNINLLSTTRGKSDRIIRLETLLQKTAVWYLGVLFLGGVILGSAYLYLLYNQRLLEQQSANLRLQIREQTVKEGLLVSLRQRVAVASKALEAARSWGKLFPILRLIAPDSYYTTLVIDENGMVLIELTLPSIDASVELVRQLLSLVDEKIIKNPQLVSLYLKEDKTTLLSISFYAVL